MRLSDIKGERTLDVIADIIDPIANIAEDPTAADLFARKALPDGENPRQFAMRRLRAGVPALLRGHKNDLISIMAAIKGTGREEYARALNLAVLLTDLYDLITDEAFMSFFTSDESGTDGGFSGESTDVSAGEV